ncbi:MAG: hypothetical protein R3B70_35840 [Polyangiaceae bacterium]
MTPISRTRRLLSLAAALSLAPLACSSGGSGDKPAADLAPSASAAASASASAAPAPDLVVGVPFPAEGIAKVVNPKKEPRYTGPTGTLRGTIRITGDAPPEVSVKLPSGACHGEAAATHSKLFRVGQDGTLADALVAVTGYKGYVPPDGEAEKITIHGCSFARRTVVATYGQRIEVSNLDKVESYMPYLDGAPAKAILVAVPGGDAVRLYPQQPGHFLIRDELPNEHLTADVFVLAYSTHDVTGLDGRYEIKGIPVGPVEVNAMLPSIHKSKGERIEIKPGDNVLDLTLTYDAKTDRPKKGTTGDPKVTPPTPPTADPSSYPAPNRHSPGHPPGMKTWCIPALAIPRVTA